MRQNVRGFTLIELLIVLIIIGIVIAGASLMLSNSHRSDQNAKAATDLFRGRLVVAQQQALLSMGTLGVSISIEGYQFSQYTEVLPQHQWVWQPITQDKILNYHAWPANMELTLETDNPRGNSIGNTLPEVPQIIFYPSGQMTAFVLTINNQYQIVGNSTGQIAAGDARG